MLTRRNVFGWLSGVGASVAGLWAATTVADPLGTAEFQKWKAWFRDNEHALWEPDTKPPTYLIRDQARKLAAPFTEANPLIEYDAWVDTFTDNVMLKTYRLDRRETGKEIALASAITRREMREHGVGNLEGLINQKWADLTEATNQALHSPLVAEWNGKVMGLAQAKYATFS